MQISQKAFDLIVNEETGGQAYYEKSEQHPDWPGGMSGVTIGCGYDLGYETAESIQNDWASHLSADMVSHLKSCAGIHGSPARALAHELRNQITVPWTVALSVFQNRDVPKWEKLVNEALPNTPLLSGDSFGALVSLAFNRGASFSLSGPRYSEMRSIKTLMTMKQFAGIPDEIRAMSRLWSKGGDLWNRRFHEAKLFEEGLVISA